MNPPSIHARPTRIVRWRRDANDERQTLIREDHRKTLVTPAANACRSCATALEAEAQFCGMCGARSKARRSLVGHVVDDLYEVRERIADGRTATIYRARYLPSGTDVALKVLHQELVLDPLTSERFRREGRCLSRLRDPHTVAVYDHGETADGTLYIAMELLRTEGLDVRIRTRGAMPWREALFVLRAVCTALAEAHALGIVHRNLEPANIRLGAGDAVKLIDFGLAKLRPDAADEELTVAGQAVGTLRYMAPEQLAGQTCDARADLYALGGIAVFLLTGRPRIPGASPALLPSDVPPEVQRVLQRCLSQSPADRFQSAVELGAALDRVLAPRAAAPVTPRSSAPRLRVLPHTPAFELEPPRILVEPPRVDDEDEPVLPHPRRVRAWAVAAIMCGIALGSAVAGCV